MTRVLGGEICFGFGIFVILQSPKKLSRRASTLLTEGPSATCPTNKCPSQRQLIFHALDAHGQYSPAEQLISPHTVYYTGS